VSDANLILKQSALHFFPTEPLSLPSHLLVESFVDDVVSVPSVIEGPPVTVEELDAALDSINYKAAGDGLSAAIIKKCFPVLKAHLLFIVREGVRLQFFPQAWKTSKVLIVGKPNKPSYDALGSFRPISLVNNLA
jgi:hypothetical protein